MKRKENIVQVQFNDASYRLFYYIDKKRADIKDFLLSVGGGGTNFLTPW